MATKKGFRKIPDKISDRLKLIKSGPVEVGVTKRYSAKALTSGNLKHLGIVLSDVDPSFPVTLVPPDTNGRASKTNSKGKEVVRRDLPKVLKTYSVELPSWGSRSHTHTVYMDRLVYLRDYYPPRFNSIEISLLNKEMGDETFYVLKFRVLGSLDIEDFDFDSDLLHHLNLLQENVGNVDIFEAHATDEEYLGTEYLDWEIFPPGEMEQVFSKIAGGRRNISGSVMARLEERYKFLLSLSPTAIIRGTNGFKNYFGAKFGEELVVFENIDYGNAIYILNQDWKELSKLSRLQLMKTKAESMKRIVHTKDWKGALEKGIKGKWL